MLTAFVCRPEWKLVRGSQKCIRDGKIGMWQSGFEWYVAQRGSQYHKKGEGYWKEKSVDSEMYKELLTNTAFPSCKQYFRNQKKKNLNSRRIMLGMSPKG